MHRRVDWMVAADDAILTLLDNNSNLYLSPSDIAYNLGYDDGYIANRCRLLTDAELLEQAADAKGPKYTVTADGAAYASGDLQPAELEQRVDSS